MVRPTRMNSWRGIGHDPDLHCGYPRVLAELSEAAVEPRSKQARRPQAPVTRQPASTASMVDQIGRAIAKADGASFESDPLVTESWHWRRSSH